MPWLCSSCFRFGCPAPRKTPQEVRGRWSFSCRGRARVSTPRHHSAPALQQMHCSARMLRRCHRVVRVRTLAGHRQGGRPPGRLCLRPTSRHPVTERDQAYPSRGSSKPLWALASNRPPNPTLDDRRSCLRLSALSSRWRRGQPLPRRAATGKCGGCYSTRSSVSLAAFAGPCSALIRTAPVAWARPLSTMTVGKGPQQGTHRHTDLHRQRKTDGHFLWGAL